MEYQTEGSGEDARFYNVALFIDYENVYKSLRREYKNAIRMGFFEKIRVWCTSHRRRLVKIAVYCNFDNQDLYESYHQSLLQNFGVETIHTSNQGKNFADLQITIDVLNAMYLNNNIDEFMIMSNDKDMTPLLNTIRLNKRKVSVITTGNDYNKAICSFSDEQIAYEDVTAEDAGRLEIEEIEDIFYDGLCSYTDSRLAAYRSARTSPPPQFSHYGLDYNLPIQMKYYKLMLYEVANILAQLKKRGLIDFYEYQYNGRMFTGLVPCCKKPELISEGILDKRDFCGFDIEQFVLDKYDSYNR